MKEELLEDDFDFLEGLDINFKIVKDKHRPNWNHIEDFLALMDEGMVSIEDLSSNTENEDPIFQMELGHKAMMMLELHLQNSRKMSAERVVKYLLSEYKR